MNGTPARPPTPARHTTAVRAANFPEALALASRDETCLIEVFVDGWSEVDMYRARAAALGLSARISVHHSAALEALVRLGLRPDSPEDPPGPFGRTVGLNRLLEQLVLAASALCRPRIITGFHRKAFA